MGTAIDLSAARDIARVCHEANRAICECAGDHSQSSWADAEDWQRESAVAGVLYRLQSPDASPEDQHAAWCGAKFKQGWAYGAEKDPEKKTHPCLVPYDQLPFEQRVKDYVFGAIVDALGDG